MEIKNLPKDTAVELLRYLAEHEDFKSLDALEPDGLTRETARAVLRELADNLQKEVDAEGRPREAGDLAHLSGEAKRILSYLSPREEKALLKAFGLIEK